MTMSEKDPKIESGGLSRRGFLKGVGAGAVASGLIQGKTGSKEAAAQSQGATQGPGNLSITLDINGSKRSLTVEPSAETMMPSAQGIFSSVSSTVFR